MGWMYLRMGSMLLVQVPVPLRSWLGEEGERALRTEEESAGGRAMGMEGHVEDDDDVAGGGWMSWLDQWSGAFVCSLLVWYRPSKPSRLVGRSVQSSRSLTIHLLDAINR